MSGFQWFLVAGMLLGILVYIDHLHKHLIDMHMHADDFNSYGDPNSRPRGYDVPLPAMTRNKDGDWLLSLTGATGIVGCTIKGDVPDEAFNAAWAQLQAQYAAKYE